MKGINSRKGAAPISTCLTAASLLLLRATRNQPVTPGSSTPSGFQGASNPPMAVTAQHPPVVLADHRDNHTCLWEIVGEVETTHPDGSRTVDAENRFFMTRRGARWTQARTVTQGGIIETYQLYPTP